jgi:hypothetical protein
MRGHHAAGTVPAVFGRAGYIITAHAADPRILCGCMQNKGAVSLALKVMAGGFVTEHDKDW